MQENSLKWDRRFIILADHIATWSKDPSTKVGAVVVAAGDRRKVAFGFNGFPKGIADDQARLDDRATKINLIIHAERNALDNATFDLTGGTIYSLRLPCRECSKGIVSKRIARVVYLVHQDYETRWKEDVAFSREIFREAGVELCPMY